MARPLKPIDAKQIEQLASIGCTAEEIAAVAGCAVSTLYDKFSESIKSGHLRRNASVRRTQYELAVVKKHAAMCIWLGKQYLGQRDNLDINKLTAEQALAILAQDADGEGESGGA